MTRRYISELASGETVEDQVFLLKQKDLRTTSNGQLYIHAVLTDKTGQIPARMWQATQDVYASLPQDGFVKVRGRLESYKNNLQLIVDGFGEVSDSDLDLDEFLPATDKDVNAMYDRVLEILRGIGDKHLLYLVKQFVNDEALMDRFKRAPAAVQMHHACIGGLLEHTLSMLELALVIGPRYEQINMDIMLTGTFLHDIGKTRELDWNGAFKYTNGGQLIGHLLVGAMLIEEKAKSAEQELGEPFPERLLQVIQHLILSHHGEYEYGAAKLPMTAEAIALHHIDNLDAKLELYRREVAEANDSDPESHWTGYVRSLERKLFKGDPFEADQK